MYISEGFFSARAYNAKGTHRLAASIMPRAPTGWLLGSWDLLGRIQCQNRYVS